MSKRQRDDESNLPTSKRRELVPSSLDQLSSLSNELLLHVLSFLPLSSLIACQGYNHPSSRIRKNWLIHPEYLIASIFFVKTPNFGKGTTTYSGYVLELADWPASSLPHPCNQKQTTILPKFQHGLITDIYLEAMSPTGKINIVCGKIGPEVSVASLKLNSLYMPAGRH